MMECRSRVLLTLPLLMLSPKNLGKLTHVGLASLSDQKSDLDLPASHDENHIFFLKKKCVFLLGQWLNFKLFGITYLVGKIKFKLFFFRVHWLSEVFQDLMKELQGGPLISGVKLGPLISRVK